MGTRVTTEYRSGEKAAQWVIMGYGGKKTVWGTISA